jgi:hypothetical protein
MSQLGASWTNGILNTPATLNRRVWVRHPCPAEKPGQMFNTESSKVCQGVVRNLSSGGIGLVLSEAVHLGTVLKVEIDGGQGPRMLVMRVTHITEQTDGWLHGCELTVPLTGEQIREMLDEAGE